MSDIKGLLQQISTKFQSYLYRNWLVVITFLVSSFLLFVAIIYWQLLYALAYFVVCNIIFFLANYRLKKLARFDSKSIATLLDKELKSQSRVLAISHLLKTDPEAQQVKIIEKQLDLTADDVKQLEQIKFRYKSVNIVYLLLCLLQIILAGILFYQIAFPKKFIEISSVDFREEIAELQQLANDRSIPSEVNQGLNELLDQIQSNAGSLDDLENKVEEVQQEIQKQSKQQEKSEDQSQDQPQENQQEKQDSQKNQQEKEESSQEKDPKSNEKDTDKSEEKDQKTEKQESEGDSKDKSGEDGNSGKQQTDNKSGENGQQGDSAKQEGDKEGDREEGSKDSQNNEQGQGENQQSADGDQQEKQGQQESEGQQGKSDQKDKGQNEGKESEKGEQQSGEGEQQQEQQGEQSSEQSGQSAEQAAQLMEKIKQKIEDISKQFPDNKNQNQAGEQGESNSDEKSNQGSENSEESGSDSEQDSKGKPGDKPNKPGEASQPNQKEAMSDREGAPDQESNDQQARSPGASASFEAKNKEKELKEGEDGRELNENDIRYQDVSIKDDPNDIDDNVSLGNEAEIKTGKEGGNYRIPLKELELSRPIAPKNSKFKIPLEYADKLD